MVDSLNTHDLDTGAEPAEHTKAMLEKAEQIEKNNNPERPDWLPEKFASVEAMAQAAGVLLLRKLPADDNKIAFFMSVDKVKFRQAVEPGDSVEIRVKLVKIRGNKIATASAECKVGGKLVSSAQLMFMLADATD